MIKRKIDVDENIAFEEACKNNDIIFTPENVNIAPVSYIINGEKKFFEPLQAKAYFYDSLPSRRIHLGDTVKVYSKVKENDFERIEIFEGIVIKRNSETFTVRKVSEDIKIDKTWFFASSYIEKIEVLNKRETRRVKLNLLRNRISNNEKIKNNNLKNQI